MRLPGPVAGPVPGAVGTGGGAQGTPEVRAPAAGHKAPEERVPGAGSDTCSAPGPTPSPAPHVAAAAAGLFK